MAGQNSNWTWTDGVPSGCWPRSSPGIGPHQERSVQRSPGWGFAVLATNAVGVRERRRPFLRDRTDTVIIALP